jgi:uncharacterized protein YodC (DUF2158 family)
MEANVAQVGKTVQLNSGGPVMTIEGIVNGDRAKCVWCNSGMLPQNDEFPIVCLTEVVKKTDIDSEK